MKIEKQKKKFSSAIEDNQKLKLYLIHHMHHFKVSSKVVHKLHHCFLFSQKNMRGKKHSVIHKLYKDEVYHCLSEKFVGTLYDHADNVFKIEPRKLGTKIIYEIKI